MAKMLFYTGARVSELVQLRVEDLHLALDPPQVYIGKAKGGSDGWLCQLWPTLMLSFGPPRLIDFRPRSQRSPAAPVGRRVLGVA